MNFATLRAQLSGGVPPGRCDEDGVRRLWWAALATLQDDLLLQGSTPLQGVWLASPLPALYDPALLRHLGGWVWSPAGLRELLPQAQPLLPVIEATARGQAPAGGFQRLPLREEDGHDPMLVLITPRLQVAMLLDGPPSARRMVVRFEAPLITRALAALDQRLGEDDPAAAADLRRRLKALGPLHNDPALGMRFWPLLAERLAAMAPSVTLQPVETQASGQPEAGSGDVAAELALLEALTHEVRTPLATIRTLIRSLLRRGDLSGVVRQRLEQIDGECSEQIDRFGLIFLAAELQRQPSRGQPLEASALARTDLSHLLRHLEAIWQRQLRRRDLALTLSITDDLPPVLSDPMRLETMLGGLMDRFSRSLPAGSHVRLRLRPAGQRLKLQLSSEGPGGPALSPSEASQSDDHARVGPVLSWNPTTGSLNLSRQATQLLFHRLGGRFTERGGSSLTVFFPVAERSAEAPFVDGV
ncbi:MAG: histidine kinase dimerization/phospho-acceptor domain-containing protein [Cyanobacteriota bacterium]|nr:histidine kinase dimerization/phospho-acceptor domain-containing protein [Cyanobacteriota bacterium]